MYVCVCVMQVTVKGCKPTNSNKNSNDDFVIAISAAKMIMIIMATSH